MSNEVLRLEAVGKTYGKDGPAPVEVLHGLDLTVARGEFCTLLGASGSGWYRRHEHRQQCHGNRGQPQSHHAFDTTRQSKHRNRRRSHPALVPHPQSFDLSEPLNAGKIHLHVSQAGPSSC